MPFELKPYPKKKKRNLEEAMCIGFWRGFEYKYPQLVSISTHFQPGACALKKRAS